MEGKLHFGLVAFILSASFLTAGFADAKKAPPSARLIEPIVSAKWLEENMNRVNLVILDIRSAEEYKAGHIAKAVNVPFLVPVSEWIAVRDKLILELPEEAALFNTIGSCGIRGDSLVVIVTTTAKPPEPPYPLANATRVADTLLYAGVKNVAILDGGFPKWVAEGKPVSKEVPVVSKVAYLGKTDKAMFVSMDYVKRQIGKVTLVDARDANVYFGVAVEPFAEKAGHIPKARCLPTPWMWRPDGSYQDTKMLGTMAAGVAGRQKAKEIVVYCGVGGYASSWWFVLTQMLGYQNVKIYDGGAQEWVRSNDMVPYRWE